MVGESATAELRSGLRWHHPPDLLVALGLAALTAALRWPFRATVLTHWDSVQYALGLYDFDLSKHTPQPPGSPFYVLLGRAASALTGDATAAFVVIAILTSAAAVGCGYLYTSEAFGRRAALLMAGVLATQPAFWYYGAAGNSWTNLALLSLLVGMCCFSLFRGQRGMVWPSALIIGLASGFRLDVLVFMGPLWLWTLAIAEPSNWRRLGAVGLVGACVASWAIPVLASVGGPGAWLNNYTAMFVPVSGRSYPLVSLAQQTAMLWGFGLLSVGPIVGLTLVSAPRRATRLVLCARSRNAMRFTAVWVVPSFLFLWLTDTTEAGHNLLFLCGLLPLVAALASRAVSGRVMLLGGAAIVFIQSAIFLFAIPRTQPPFAWTVNSILLGFTAPALREQQDTLRSTVSVVREHFDPSDTEILTLDGQDVFRFAMYYLPEFTVVRLPEGGYGAMRARGLQPLPSSEPPCANGRVNSVWIVWATTPRQREPQGAIAVPLLSQHQGTRWRVLATASCSE